MARGTEGWGWNVELEPEALSRTLRPRPDTETRKLTLRSCSPNTHFVAAGAPPTEFHHMRVVRGLEARELPGVRAPGMCHGFSPRQALQMHDGGVRCFATRRGHTSRCDVG